MEVVVTIIDFLMVIGLNRAYSQGELRVHVSKANDEPIKKVINDNGSWIEYNIYLAVDNKYC